MHTTEIVRCGLGCWFVARGWVCYCRGKHTDVACLRGPPFAPRLCTLVECEPVAGVGSRGVVGTTS